MDVSISFAQELRAIRNGNNGGERTKQTSNHWLAAVNPVRQTFSRLLGAEHPAAVLDSEKTGSSLSDEHTKTLNDHIGNEPVVLSKSATEEVVEAEEEQTQAAPEEVQDEVPAREEQVTSEFQENPQNCQGPDQTEIDVVKQSRDRIAEIIQTQTDELARWAWVTCKGTGTPIPAQIEKLMEPYVEEARAKFAGSFRQQVQDLVTEQEQVVQGKLSSFQDQIGTLDQTLQQIYDQKADAISKLSEERLSALAEKAVQNFEEKVRDGVEGGFSRFQTRFGELESASLERLQRAGEQQMDGYAHKLEGLSAEMEEKVVSQVSGRVEETAAKVIESSLEQLHHQASADLEDSKRELKGLVQLEAEGVREQLSGLGRTMSEVLSQDVARLTDTVRQADQELTAIEQKHLAASEQQLSALSQTTMESFSARLKQIADLQIEEVSKISQDFHQKATAQFEFKLQEVTEGQCNGMLQRIQDEAGMASAKATAEVKAASESVMEELSHKVNDSTSALKEEAGQATSRFELSINNSLEAYQQQLAQVTEARLEEHRKAITANISELQNRLKQATELLTVSPLQS